MSTAVRERHLSQMPWWLWPTALCTLAPTAAWGWQALFARVTNVQLQPVTHQVLFFTVWMVGLADRLFESRRGQMMSWRHWFMRRYQTGVLLLLGILGLVLGRLLLWFLPQSILELGIFLIVPVLFYLFFSRMEMGPRAALPREIVRGAIFSAGVLLPTYGSASVPPAALQLLIAQTLLISLIFLNVSCREHVDLPGEEAHRDEWMAIDQRLGVWLGLVLVTVLWLARMESKQIGNALMGYYLTMALVTVLALLLYVFRHQFKSDTLHLASWAILAIPAALALI